ncbi:MAG: hypothetical protein A2138_11560 [Deltaproteobacteria bacterium RBG_16_71_12]|nr:MAG: hypothetical protein A2138_11560 [Deltaproteobacteria bacterium RBG_16_71_12]
MVLRSLILCVSLFVWLTSAPAVAAPLSGTYSSPLGPLTLVEKDGAVTARIVDGKKNPCGFAKGMTVLEGSRLDDSVVGTFSACKVGDGCTGVSQGSAMLLVTKNGATLSGAVHLDAGACKTILGGDSIVLKKGKRSSATKPAVPVVDKAPPRARAEKLAADAFAKYQQDGNAEAARASFVEATKVDPSYAEGYIGVGMTYKARDRLDEALDWYKRALEANPAVGDAYYNIGCVYAVRGDKEQALRYLRIALLNGYVQLDTLLTDPDLKGLAGDPQFEKLKAGQTD